MHLNTFLLSNLGPIIAQLLESELGPISDNINVDNYELKALFFVARAETEHTLADKRAMAVLATRGFMCSFSRRLIRLT